MLKTKFKNLFASFLRYYILIVAIPITVSIVLFFYGKNLLEKEVINANRVVINQVKMAMDSEFNKVRKVAATISVDQGVLNLLSINDLDGVQRYKFYEKYKDLQKYMTSNDIVSSICIYLNDVDCFWTSGGMISKDYIGTSIIDSAVWKYDDWNSLINISQYERFISIKDDNGNQQGIMYVRTIPYYTGSPCKANLFLNLNCYYINSIIQNNTSGEEIVVFDDSNNVVAYNCDSTILSALQEVDINNSQYVKLKNNDYYAYIAYADDNRFKYLSLLPTNKINSALSYYWFFGGLGFIIITIACIFILLRIKKNQYEPFSKTIELLKNSFDDANNLNDFRKLELAVQNTITTQNSMQEDLVEGKIHMRNYFLTRLLRGEIQENQYSDFLEYHDLHMDLDSFSVLIFYQDKEKQSDSNDNLLEVLEKIQTDFKSQSEQNGIDTYLFPVLVGGMYILIINYTIKADKDFTIHNWLLKYDMYLKEKQINIAVSNRVSSIMQLSKAYKQAEEALETAMVYGLNGINLYSNSISNKINNIKYYQYENNFIHVLENYEYDKAINIVNNIFSLVVNEQKLNLGVVKCRMFGLINIMINHIEKLNYSEKSIDFNVIAERLIGFQNIDSLREELIGVINQIKNNVVKQDKSNDGLINQVKSFIDENFKDSYMSVSYIADKFGVELPILSKKFKKEQKINVLDYINLTRIKYAKDLMKDNSITVKEMAEKCGYLNSDSLIRVFRRYEGVTPGKYNEYVKVKNQ